MGKIALSSSSGTQAAACPWPRRRSPRCDARRRPFDARRRRPTTCSSSSSSLPHTRVLSLSLFLSPARTTETLAHRRARIIGDGGLPLLPRHAQELRHLVLHLSVEGIKPGLRDSSASTRLLSASVRECRRHFWVAAGDSGDPTVRRHHLLVALDEARRMSLLARPNSRPIDASIIDPRSSPLMTSS